MGTVLTFLAFKPGPAAHPSELLPPVSKAPTPPEQQPPL